MCGRTGDRSGGPIQVFLFEPRYGFDNRSLAKLAPRTLALMHGPAFVGDGSAALQALAEDYDRRVSDNLARSVKV
jgi:hypothetical protein